MKVWIHLGLLAVGFAWLFSPVFHYSARFNVEVTWSVRDATEADHVVTFEGESFSIPAGGSTTRKHRLNGGGKSDWIFNRRGWGFGSSGNLIVNGEVVHPGYVKTRDRSGTLKIFGMGGEPKSEVVIMLDEWREFESME